MGVARTRWQNAKKAAPAGWEEHVRMTDNFGGGLDAAESDMKSLNAKLRSCVADMRKMITLARQVRQAANTYAHSIDRSSYLRGLGNEGLSKADAAALNKALQDACLMAATEHRRRLSARLDAISAENDRINRLLPQNSSLF